MKRYVVGGSTLSNTAKPHKQAADASQREVASSGPEGASSRSDTSSARLRGVTVLDIFT